VELVAVVPFVLLVAAVAWQLALAGDAAWLSAHAARAAARADAVGRSPEAAARRALPHSLEAGLRVRRLRDGGVRASLRVPAVLRALASPARVSATSSLGGADGG
jgi:pilus assembly protein CpaE